MLCACQNLHAFYTLHITHRSDVMCVSKSTCILHITHYTQIRCYVLIKIYIHFTHYITYFTEVTWERHNTHIRCCVRTKIYMCCIQNVQDINILLRCKDSCNFEYLLCAYSFLIYFFYALFFYMTDFFGRLWVMR